MLVLNHRSLEPRNCIANQNYIVSVEQREKYSRLWSKNHLWFACLSSTNVIHPLNGLRMSDWFKQANLELQVLTTNSSKRECQKWRNILANQNGIQRSDVTWWTQHHVIWPRVEWSTPIIIGKTVKQGYRFNDVYWLSLGIIHYMFEAVKHQSMICNENGINITIPSLSD